VANPQAEPQPQKGGDLESPEFLLAAALRDVARQAGGDEQQLVWVESLEEGRRLHAGGGLRSWRHQRRHRRALLWIVPPILEWIDSVSPIL